MKRVLTCALLLPACSRLPACLPAAPHVSLAGQLPVLLAPAVQAADRAVGAM
jgi:hypothetical protein